MNKKANSVGEAKTPFGAMDSKATKLVAIGNSTGVILPKRLLARMRIDQGDQVTLCETPDGIMIRVYDPEFEAQMDAAEAIMREDRDILRELAK